MTMTLLQNTCNMNYDVYEGGFVEHLSHGVTPFCSLACLHLFFLKFNNCKLLTHICFLFMWSKSGKFD